MAAAVAKKAKTSSSNTGAPSQYRQSSRKGKKAWRKNVDIGEVEGGLEEMRAEERETGSSLRSKTNDELFQVDVKGDEDARKRLPKFDKSQLSYYKALAQRSAVPAVLSRHSTSSTKKPIRITQEDKKRLLRIGKRKRRGPFDSIEDTSELGKGSALLDPSHAVKQSGTYDVWSAEDRPTNVNVEKADFLTPLVEKPKVKAPQSSTLREEIAVPTVVVPHAGSSYNPPVDAHQELLRLANEKAEREEKEAEKLAGLKERMDAARMAQSAEVKPGVPIGMSVDDGKEQDGHEDDDEQGDAPLPKKPTVRKTKQQRKKAEKQRAEKRALAERAAKKRLLATLDSVKSTKKIIDGTLSARERARIQRRLLLQKKLRRSGLAGRRLGKHVIPEAEPDVQLGEDLSESLRSLKVEGNLFRDRFLSMQHRALLEPRVPVLPKKHRPRMKEVEKFAWKRFE